jgi:hypothetical protein
MNTKFWWENLKGGDHLQDLGVDGRIRKWNKSVWVAFVSFRIAYFCENGNEPTQLSEVTE